MAEKQKEEAKIALHEEGEGESVNGMGGSKVNAALQCNTSKGET